MPSSTSPNMVLFLPVPGSTAGPQWANSELAKWLCMAIGLAVSGAALLAYKKVVL